MMPAEIVAQVIAEMQAVMDHPTALAGNVPLGRWRDALAALAVSPSVQQQEQRAKQLEDALRLTQQKDEHVWNCKIGPDCKECHRLTEAASCARFDVLSGIPSSPAVTGLPRAPQKRRYAQLAEYIAVSLCQPRRARQVELILDGWFSARAEAHAAPAEAPHEQDCAKVITMRGRDVLVPENPCTCGAEAPSEEQETLRRERDYLRDVVLRQANRITELQSSAPSEAGLIASVLTLLRDLGMLEGPGWTNAKQEALERGLNRYLAAHPTAEAGKEQKADTRVDGDQPRRIAPTGSTAARDGGNQ